MTILIFWLLFAVGVGVFASNRGRSGLGWFLLSVLLSPLIGLLFVAVSKDLSKSAVAGQMDTGPRVKCPACAEWVRPEAKLCKHCGTALTPSDAWHAEAHHQALEDESRDSIKTALGTLAIVAAAVVVVMWLK